MGFRKGIRVNEYREHRLKIQLKLLLFQEAPCSFPRKRNDNYSQYRTKLYFFDKNILIQSGITLIAVEILPIFVL